MGGAPPRGATVNAPLVDRARLARAAHLVVTPVGPGRWSVSGGRAVHVVTLEAGRLRCDCPDQQLHGAGCKHVLACVLARLPRPVREALRDVVPAPTPRRRQARP